MGVKDFGRLRANPAADKKHVLKLDNMCLCSTTNACQDKIVKALASAPNLTGITFMGVAYTPPAPIPISNAAAVEAWLVEIALKYEFDVFISAKIVGSNIEIIHIGKGAFTLPTFSAGAAATVTRWCTTAVKCHYKVNLVGDPGEVNDGVTGATLANVPYEYTGVILTDTSTADDLETDIAAALTGLSIAYDSVTVSVDEADESYLVDIVALEGTPIYFGSKKAKQCLCDEVFVSA